MKKSLNLIFFAAFVLVAANMARADIFTVSVNIPQASAANFDVFKVTDPDNWPTKPIATTSLSFTTYFNAKDSTFLGNEFYAINVQPLGAGGVNVKITYEDDSMPVGQTVGLGDRAKIEAAAVRISDNDETSILVRSLTTAHNQTVLASSIPEGQYMRFYVSLADGLEADAVLVEPFTSADKPGDYFGTLTLTALAPG